MTDGRSTRPSTEHGEPRRSSAGPSTPSHGGLGLATEAVTGLLRLCFEELAVRRVTASCFAANDRSWRLMERVGMRREGNHIQESLHRSGIWLDTYTYALLVAER